MTTPPMTWCGVDHPHAQHIWVQPTGMAALYSQCPGSTGMDATILDAQPGDTVVLHVEGPLSHQRVADIKQWARDVFPEGVRIAAVEKSVAVSITRRAAA